MIDVLKEIDILLLRDIYIWICFFVVRGGILYFVFILENWKYFFIVIGLEGLLNKRVMILFFKK